MFFSACNNNYPAPIPVTDIAFEPPLPTKQLSLSVNETYQLNAKAKPDNATNTKLTYTSDTPTVASVNDKGVITAKKAGQAVVTIKAANNISKEITVTVTAVPVTDIVFDPALPGNPLSLSVGGTCPLHAKVQPENATDKNLTYSSDNEGVAFVDAGGLITAKAVGSAKITIKASNNVAKEITVTVTTTHIPVTEITLPFGETTISLVNGDIRQINAHAMPENATNKQLTYSSDKAAIASVAADGMITANGVGSAHITIQAADGITKILTVTVTTAYIPVTSIEFEDGEPANPVELVIGQVYKFGAKAMPEEATNRKLTFTTSNSSIAWLCGEGNSEVKADGLGDATVTITSEDNPSVKKEVHFKMKPKPEIKIKTTPAECESNGGEATFTIETLKGKLDYTPEVVEGGAKWLSVAGKDHTDESTDTVRLTVQTNKTVWNRTARIRFKDNITNEYIKISSKKYLEVQLTQKKMRIRM